VLTAVCAGASVTALLAITAVASRKPLSGVGQTSPPGVSGAAQVSAPPWALALLAAGAAIGLLGVITLTGLRLPRRRKKDPYRAEVLRIPWLARVMALLVALCLSAVLVVAAIEGSHVHHGPMRPTQPPPAARVQPRRRAAGHGSSFAVPGWILPAVLGVLLGGAGTIVLVLAFRDRARAVNTGLAASDEQVANVCSRLDGLPLAIELAAARVNVLAVEQIVAKLREAEKLQAQGLTIPQTCKRLGISDQTFYRWRIKYGALKEDEAQRLKALEQENARLKKIVAEQALDISLLKDLQRGNW